jgi:hypothetical protein
VGGVAQGVAEEVDGVVLEAEPDVGVDGRGDADVGVSEKLLDDDEFDALLQEQGCRQGDPLSRVARGRAGAAPLAHPGHAAQKGVAGRPAAQQRP